MSDLNDIFSKLNSSNVQSNLNSIKQKLNTPEGQRIKEKLKNLDKNALLASLGKLDKNSVPSGGNLGNAADDPDFLKKFSQFLDSQTRR